MKTTNLSAEASADNETPRHFEIVAYTGGKLRVDGFEAPVVVDLAGLEASGEIPIALKHDLGDATILGQTDPNEITNDGSTLTLGGIITADPEQSPAVKRVLAMGKNGHKWQASIGAQIEESEDIEAGQTVEVNGQSLEGPFVLATRAVLRETSVLGMGADKNTSVVFSAAVKLDLTAEAMDDTGFESWCKDELQIDPGTLTEKARNALLQQYDATTRDVNDVVDAKEDLECTGDDELEAEEAETTDDEETPAEDAEESTSKQKPPTKGKKAMSASGNTNIKASTQNAINETRKLEAAEERRKINIRAKCGDDSMLIATAIEKGWSPIQAENEYLKRQARKRAPAGHCQSNDPQDTLQAVSAGLLLRAGVQLDHPEFSGEMGLALKLPTWLRAGINKDNRQKAMEAGYRFRDISLPRLCEMLCTLPPSKFAQAGWDSHNDGSQMGFIRAAISGGQLADIFSTNINALLIQKLVEIGDTTAGWTTERDAANFQTMDDIRLTKAGGLTKHARGGKADDMTRSDIIESYKIARYSKMFKADEMDIIDDRFKALQDMPNEMALACARLRPDLCYAILQSNPTLNATSQALFSASQPGSQSNLLASGGTLASATLQAGMATMFNQQENGVNLGIYPTHVLVPMVLAGLAFNLLQGQNIALAGTAGTVTERGDVNPLAALQAKFGKIEVVSDPRLTNGTIDPNTGTSYSGSTTTWRLISNKVKTIEVAYLRGAGRAPQVRQFLLERGEWGVGWDVNMDIGAKALEWRGMYEARA